MNQGRTSQFDIILGAGIFPDKGPGYQDMAAKLEDLYNSSKFLSGNLQDNFNQA